MRQGFYVVAMNILSYTSIGVRVFDCTEFGADRIVERGGSVYADICIVGAMRGSELCVAYATASQ
jgi:hypothetical protein